MSDNLVVETHGLRKTFESEGAPGARRCAASTSR